MTYAIQLRTQEPSRELFHGRSSFRVVMDVLAAENVPLEIFGHQATLIDPTTEEAQDEFLFVCSAFDLSIYPANAPAEEQDPPFFRKSGIDVLLPSLELATLFIDSVKEQVNHLLRQMEALDDIEVVDEIWLPIGYTPPTTTTVEP